MWTRSSSCTPRLFDSNVERMPSATKTAAAATTTMMTATTMMTTTMTTICRNRYCRLVIGCYILIYYAPFLVGIGALLWNLAARHRHSTANGTVSSQELLYIYIYIYYCQRLHLILCNGWNFYRKLGLSRTQSINESSVCVVWSCACAWMQVRVLDSRPVAAAVGSLVARNALSQRALWSARHLAQVESDERSVRRSQSSVARWRFVHLFAKYCLSERELSLEMAHRTGLVGNVRSLLGMYVSLLKYFHFHFFICCCFVWQRSRAVSPSDILRLIEGLATVCCTQWNRLRWYYYDNVAHLTLHRSEATSIAFVGIALCLAERYLSCDVFVRVFYFTNCIYWIDCWFLRAMMNAENIGRCWRRHRCCQRFKRRNWHSSHRILMFWCAQWRVVLCF